MIEYININLYHRYLFQLNTSVINHYTHTSQVIIDKENHAEGNTNISVSLQPKLMAKDLLDLVASHFNLKEKEYFGIAYTDET